MEGFRARRRMPSSRPTGISLTQSSWCLSSKSSAICFSAPSATCRSRINTEPNDASPSYCDTIVAFGCRISLKMIRCRWMRHVVRGGRSDWRCSFFSVEFQPKPSRSPRGPQCSRKGSYNTMVALGLFCSQFGSWKTLFSDTLVESNVQTSMRCNSDASMIEPKSFYCSTKRICYAVQGLPLFILKTRHDCLHVA